MLHNSRAIPWPLMVASWGRLRRRGRWPIHVTSTAPRRAGSCLFFCLSRRVPAYLCMSVPIYILYIYRAIRGTGEIWGWLFPGLLVCVYHGRGLIPSRIGGGKLPPENRIYCLMQLVGVYLPFGPPIKHAPRFPHPLAPPASRLRRWVDGLGRPLFMGVKFVKFCQVSGAVILASCTPRGPGVVTLFFSTLETPGPTKVVQK